MKETLMKFFNYWNPVLSIQKFSFQRAGKIIVFLIVSQAAACDGTKITTTASGQEVAPGTLPIY